MSASRIRLLSPEEIWRMSYGEVTKPEMSDWAKTYGEKADINVFKGRIVAKDIGCDSSFSPIENGLYCSKIFGPADDLECHCGKYKGIKHKGTICNNCLVEVASSKVTRERFGHIRLAAAVVHPWFKDIISGLLDLPINDFAKILYFECYIVIEPGDTPLRSKQLLEDAEYKKHFSEYGSGFKADTGARAIERLLKKVDMRSRRIALQKQLQTEPNTERQAALKKDLQFLDEFEGLSFTPELFILHLIPVLPSGLRPPGLFDSFTVEGPDLNKLYGRIINRNNRLKRLIQLKAPEVIIKNEKRMLQEAVDALVGNSRVLNTWTGGPLRSLSYLLIVKLQQLREKLIDSEVVLQYFNYGRFYSKLIAEAKQRYIEPHLILNRKVEDLELSGRAYNCLKNAGLKTVADIVQKTEHELLKSKAFGRISLNQTKEVLRGMGLYLGMQLDQANNSIEELRIATEDCKKEIRIATEDCKEELSVNEIVKEISYLLRAMCLNVRHSFTKQEGSNSITNLEKLLVAYIPHVFTEAEHYSQCTKYYEEAQTLRNQGKYEEAISCCNNILKLEPTNIEALFLKGNCLRYLRRHFEAINCYDEIPEVNEMAEGAWLYKGLTYNQMGANEEAIRCYDKALEMAPEYIGAWINKGIATMVLDRPTEAIFCYDKALAISPKNEIALFYKGNAFLAMNSYAEAVCCYDKVLEVNPDNFYAWCNKGISLAQKRNSKTKSQNESSKVFLSEIFGEIPSLESILICYDESLKINPQYTDALFMKGHILYDLKRTALALRCFEQVLEVEPANYDAWYFQAIVQDELGRKKKAGISFKKFLGLAPDNQDMEAGIKYVLQRIEELGE